MTKMEVKKYLKELNERCRIVDWDWDLWKTKKIVMIIMISKNHIAYSASYCLDGNILKIIPGSIECI